MTRQRDAAAPELGAESFGVGAFQPSHSLTEQAHGRRTPPRPARGRLQHSGDSHHDSTHQHQVQHDLISLTQPGAAGRLAEP
jgi:hypothetical protein